MNINRKRALLEALKEPMPYARLVDYGVNFDGVVELLNSGMIRRHPGGFGLYSIAPGGQRWLDVQSEVAACIQEYLEGRVQMGLQPQKRAVAEILGLPRRNFPPDHWDAIINQWRKMMLAHAIELAKELAERQGSPCTEYQLRTRLKAGRTTSASMKNSKVWEEILQEAITATGGIATPPPAESFVAWVRCSFCTDKLPAELLINIGASSRPMCPECFAAYRQAVKRDEGVA